MAHVLFENEYFCVIFKAAGEDFHKTLTVLPSPDKAYCIYPLDEALCGPLLCAKTKESSHELKNAYGSDLFSFEFLLWGYAQHVLPPQWECDLSIAWDGEKVFPSKVKGKKARTQFKLERSYGNYHLIKCCTHYLRRLQIPLHAYYGQAIEILGDTIFSKNGPHYVCLSDLKPFVKNCASGKALSEGLHLCLQGVSFNFRGQSYNFTVPLPKAWEVMERQLKRYSAV